MITKDVSLAAVTDLTQRYRTAIRIVVILLIAILLTWVILKIVRAFKKPVNATYVPGGGTLPQGWDPKIITKKLFDAIDGTMNALDLRDALHDFNTLNDNQIIDVYNTWNKEGYADEKKYYMFSYGSFSNALKDKVNLFTVAIPEKDVALANLERLHLL